MSTAYDPFYDEEDRNYESNYCVHGTFIGNPYGGDYLCGWCEDGVSLEDFRAYRLRQANYARRKSTWENFLATAFDSLHAPLSQKGSTLPESYFELIIAIVVNGARA